MGRRCMSLPWYTAASWAARPRIHHGFAGWQQQLPEPDGAHGTIPRPPSCRSPSQRVPCWWTKISYVYDTYPTWMCAPLTLGGFEAYHQVSADQLFSRPKASTRTMATIVRGFVEPVARSCRRYALSSQPPH